MVRTRPDGNSVTARKLFYFLVVILHSEFRINLSIGFLAL